MTTTIGIAGVTGKFGRSLASKLLTHSEVAVRGYCRDAGKIPSSLSASTKVEIVEGGAFDAEAVRSFVRGCHVVVCSYLGDDRLMIDGQKFLIDACEENGIPRYIASDWSLDYTKLEFGQLFVKDPMKHVKAYLETKTLVKGVHILVGRFMDAIFSPLFGVWDPSATTFRFWGTGDEIWEGTSYENAAEYTAAVALDSSAVGIQRLVGDRLTLREIAAAFERVYDLKVKLECLGSQNDLYERMHHLRETNPGKFYNYLFLFFQYYVINGQTLVGPELDNSKYPDDKRVSWEEFMRTIPVEKLRRAITAVGANVQRTCDGLAS